MKKFSIMKIVIEGVASVIFSLAAENISAKLKRKHKEECPEDTLVGDLTIEEFRKILREEVA